MESKKVELFNKLSLFTLMGTLFISFFFFIPFSPVTLEASKGFLVSIGTTLSLFFWLVSRLGAGKFKIPKDRLIIFGAVIPIIFLISSFFSSSLYNSLFGTGFEVGTFGTMLILFIIFFLSAVHFNTEKRLWYFLGLIFIGAIILSIFEILNIIMGLNGLFPNFLQGVSSANLVGNWNNFTALFGLFIILSIFTIEFLKTRRLFLWIQYIILVLGIIFLILINVPLIWLLVGIFSIIIFIYSISVQHTGVNVIKKNNDKNKFPATALVVIFVSLLFLVGNNFTGNIVSKYINIPNIDVRPSIVTTAQVSFKSLKNNPVLGSGPNTFVNDWSLWKPKAVSETIFWNIDFSNGFSFMATTLSTTGVLGFGALLLFLIVLISRGIQSLRIALQNPISNYFIITNLLISIYSWIIIIVYNPNIIILSLAFASSGMLIGILIYKKVIPVRETSFFNHPRNSFFAILGIMILMFMTLSLTYIYTEKLVSVLYFSQSLNNDSTQESLSRSEKMLLKAIKLNKNDVYYRNLSQIYVSDMRLLLQDKKISEDTLKSNLQQLLILAEQSANNAIKQNPKKYLNYLNMGNVYGAFSSLSIKDSYEGAMSSFDKAKKLAPNNPSIFLAQAQVQFMNNKIDEAKASIDEALILKTNYTDAFFLRAQIDAEEGNMSGAIKQVEKAAAKNPNDQTIFFRLGMLRYNNSDYTGAISAFEKAVILDTSYLDARYFLGQSYQKVGRNDDALIQYNILSKVLPNSQDIKNALNSISKPQQSVDIIKDNKDITTEETTNTDSSKQ